MLMSAKDVSRPRDIRCPQPILEAPRPIFTHNNNRASLVEVTHRSASQISSTSRTGRHRRIQEMVGEHRRWVSQDRTVSIVRTDGRQLESHVLRCSAVVNLASCATISARLETENFANILRRWVDTVHALISRADAIA